MPKLRVLVSRLPTSFKKATRLVALFALFLHIPLVLSAAQASSFAINFDELATLAQPKRNTVISSVNIEANARFIDVDIAALIKKGEFSITVGDTQSFAVHENYVSASEQNAQTVSLGDKPGIINDYVTGRPFPAPLSAADSRAGDKAAWNMRYSYAPDENEVREFIWQYKNKRSGKLERTLKMYGSMLRFNHRHTQEPKPSLPNNKSEIFNALYLRVDRPQDVRNTQLLVHRQEDDTRSEKAWLYSATQRRVRVLATGQTTDAFLGSDIMIEDFLGFNGRIMDMNWRYIESKWTLVPLYRHSELPKQNLVKEADDSGFQLVGFHGQGACFPNVTWQMRKVHIVEAVPVDKQHPLSKRIFYIDTQGYGAPLIKIYDRGGKLWKIGIGAVSDSDYHHPANKDWRGGITDAVAMIDIQAEHCTTIQMLPTLPAQPLRPSQFTPQQLRAAGR